MNICCIQPAILHVVKYFILFMLHYLLCLYHAQESRDSVAKIRSSLLNLVDLAGSERQRDAHTEGLRLKVIIILLLHISCAYNIMYVEVMHRYM